MDTNRQTIATGQKVPLPSETDGAYVEFLATIRKPFGAHAGKVFETDASGLWDAFLAALPEEIRQNHTCHACRHFVERFGHLVTLDEQGNQTPAMWTDPDSVTMPYRAAAWAMGKLVRKAKVTGVFLSREHVYGQPETGPWRHMAALPAHVFRETTLRNAGQAMAEKLEEYGMLQRSLAEFPEDACRQALLLLSNGQLYRSEKCIGVARWLVELHAARGAAKGRARDNVTWLAVAVAPPGFAHVRSGMIGTLLSDIVEGLPFETVRRRFDEKMSPILYQRPQAAPSAGNIAQAEKVIAELRAAGALDRRFARLEDVQDFVWRPSPPKADVVEPGGVFGHLKPKSTASPVKPSSSSPIIMTWRKFATDVLPAALSVEAFVSGYVPSTFAALVTAVNPDAPPILQWDREEKRNAVSWYLYHGGSPARQWGLSEGYVSVTAVTLQPSVWGNGVPHQGEGVLFVLKGCVDSREAGNALFPEILRSEFHGIRSTLEAFSRGAQISGREDATACGLMLQKATGNWNAAIFRVATPLGLSVYKLDRWD